MGLVSAVETSNKLSVQKDFKAVKTFSAQIIIAAFRRNQITCPADTEIIAFKTRKRSLFPPVKIKTGVKPGDDRLSFKFLIGKIFTAKAPVFRV